MRAMSSSISVRSVARCTFAAYAGRATVLLPTVAITVVIVSVVFGACSRVLELAGRAAGHGPGVAAQLLAATVLVPIPLLGVTALYFELRRVAGADLS